MSHYTVLRTQFVDVDALVKALADLGFAHVEVHEKPRHLRGWLGGVRLNTAEIIIRRKYVGKVSNDIGFKRQKDGTFTAIISKYDRYRFRYNDAWMGRLAQRYAYHVTLAKLTEQGFELVTEKQEQGRIHLTLRQMA